MFSRPEGIGVGLVEVEAHREAGGVPSPEWNGRAGRCNRVSLTRAPGPAVASVGLEQG